MPGREEKIVVYAPFSRDADSILTLLQQRDLNAVAVVSLEELVQSLGENIGAVLLTEEALAQSNWGALIDAVRDQPSWSSYPFILLIGQKRSIGQTEAVYALFPPEVTNVMVLERPMSTTALLSAVRWALAGRRRQFVTKDHLDELEHNAQQQRLMTRELAHRVKNTIAILQSIVTQTMRPYPDTADLKDRIMDRFSALARTHDLLLGTDFSAADFPELVKRTISVQDGRFEAEGPSVQVSPQAALSFALVLHELATNATKYGAFSSGNENGLVHIKWWVEHGEEASFHFQWRECGGPGVSTPTALGFGTRLIRSTLAGLGDVELSYPAEGFSLAFKGPLQRLTYSVVPTFSTHKADANLP